MLQCKRCGYETNTKQSLLRHFHRKNICTPSIEDIHVDILINELESEPNNQYKCCHCGKCFAYSSN